MCYYANFGSTIVIYEVTTYACIRTMAIWYRYIAKYYIAYEQFLNN